VKLKKRTMSKKEEKSSKKEEKRGHRASDQKGKMKPASTKHAERKEDEG